MPELSVSIEQVNDLLQNIKDKLKMVNAAALQPVQLTKSKFEELEDVHYLISKRENFSISEIDAIVKELGSILRSE